MMFFLWRTFLIASFFLMSPWSVAQLVPSDTSYSVHEKDGYHYIFPELYKGHVPKAVEFNEHLRRIYEKSFRWKLEERASLVLASERNQIANGFATVSPNTLTFFYPSGFSILDNFASPNWFTVLLIHESAHLYQLDAKGKVSSLFKSIFGNPMLIVTPYVPVFIHPNQFAPGFMLEGNAVMNESTQGIGGRLHSGQVRALVFQLIKQGKVTDERLFNDHLYFPFYTGKYLLGGYFNAFLAKTYGVDRANRYFLEQGQHFINPLIVNKTFRNHYGKSYSQLLREFVVSYKDVANSQQSAPYPVLYNTMSFSKMNADENRIWFLAQEDFKSTPYLTIIDKNKSRWTQELKDLPSGKIFWVDDEPVVATSQRHSIRYIENSLFGEGLKFNNSYRSQIVQDMRAGKTASIDGTSQFFANNLSVNDQHIGDVHSSVVLSNSGEAIYFLQDKDQRTLVRSTEKLGTFKGFYGYPMEELADGSVTFIGATTFGSGLFQWKDNKFFRLSTSDLIIDARQIKDHQFLVTEITGNGYEYKVIAVDAVEETPVAYDYGLESNKKMTTEELAAELRKQPNAEADNQYRDYSTLGDIRYSSTNFEIGGAEPGGLQGYISSTFIDPLFYNAFNLSYQRVFDSNSISTQYILNKYVFKPYIGYLYNEDRVRIAGGTKEDAYFYYNQQAFVGFTVPLFIWRRWTGGWNSDVAYDKSDLLNDRFEENLEITNAMQFAYTRNYPLAYEPYRYWDLTLAQQEVRSSYDLNNKDSVLVGQMKLGGDIGLENYFSLQYTEGVAEKDNIRLSFTRSIKNDFVRVTRLFPEHSIDLKRIRAIEASYKRPFDTPLYFTRFPMSFRRSAIYLEGGYYDAETSTSLDSWFVDYRYGVELETIVMHRMPLRIKMGAQHTTEQQQSGLLLHIESKKEF